MKTFIHSDFLLETEASKNLFHNYAEKLPIIDYHNHLSPKLIAENANFETITAIWLAGDHYKWRAMRALGIDETLITGDASDRDKFMAFAKSVPYMIRNPLFHWTQLELSRYFEIDELLTEKNALEIYNRTNELLNSSDFSTQSLLKKMNVESLCTTEDPLDQLQFHQQIKQSNTALKVSTAFRPDKFILIDRAEFNTHVDSLSAVANISISGFDDLCEALQKRMNFFHENGCRLSDHGLEFIPFINATNVELKEIFDKRRAGADLTLVEIQKFQTALLLFLGKAYHNLGWVQQFHLGAMRNNNTRMFAKMGADTGWDSIGSYPISKNLSLFLDALDKDNNLAKTILYNLNPSDNEVMATMIGNFNDGSSRGKIQWGSGWWFLDQLDGMTDQMNVLSNMGLISCFIGMLTDSRSFLSFPRHEYFRRLVCNLFGNDIERGLLPNDINYIGGIVQDICYNNAKSYFNF